MAKKKQSALAVAREAKLSNAMEILRALGFTARQSNEVAGYTLLALLDLKPSQAWSDAAEPLRGITPVIDFVAEAYGVRYAPNTRETMWLFTTRSAIGCY
jgi:BsuBI/PstI restriction endonuclease HTH domain